jgi:hypothetical protein
MAVSKAWLNLITAVLFPYLWVDANIFDKDKTVMARKILDECIKQFGPGPSMTTRECRELFIRLFPVPAHKTKHRFSGDRNTGVLVVFGDKLLAQMKQVKLSYTSEAELAKLAKLKFVTELDSDDNFEIKNCDLDEYAINRIKEGNTRNNWGKPASSEKWKDPVFQEVRRSMLTKVFGQSPQPHLGHVGLNWQASNLEFHEEETDEDEEEEEKEETEETEEKEVTEVSHRSTRYGSKAEVSDAKKRKSVSDVSRLPYGGKKPRTQPNATEEMTVSLGGSLVDTDGGPKPRIQQNDHQELTFLGIPLGSPLLDTNY